MTNPSKAWAMLTARGVQYSGALGGIPELTPAEIARHLNGLPRGPFLAGMVKECSDTSLLTDLERCLFIETLAMADPVNRYGRFVKRRAWPSVPGQALCRRLVGLAVFEFLVPRPAKCEPCKGRGWILAHGQGVSCPKCGDSVDGSTGGQTLAPEMRAELAGVPMRYWRDGWSERYERVHAAVWGWHHDALTHVARAFGVAEQAEDEELEVV